MNYRWPAEWEPHQGTLIAWPHNQEDWPDRFGPIPFVYGEIIKHLAMVEEIHIIVNEETKPEAQNILQRMNVPSDAIHYRLLPTDRVWTRDFAPTWVKDKKQQSIPIKWQFNAWAKYDNWHLDHEAGLACAGTSAVTAMHNGKPVVLEGGSIDGNGDGIMLTTEECLLSPEQCRNPGFTKADYETIFATYLGIEKTLWLNNGIAGDDTHGHVDDLARFVNKNTIVCAYEPDKNDANHAPTKENLDRLRAMTNQRGEKFQIIPLPMPAPIVFDGQRLPASYANFYIANKKVLVPTFNDPNDRHALNILAMQFPDHEVVGIYCGDLVWGLGTLHCMTQQLPG